MYNQKHQLLSTITILIFMVLFFVTAAQAAEVTLSWNKPADSRVIGYNIYCGISGTEFKSEPVQVINSVDQGSCVLLNLEEGQLYNFAATSFDADGNESNFSETIGSLIPEKASDIDNDGFTVEEGDCNDNNASIHPGAIEICGDGIDQDCNGTDLECTSDPRDIDDDGDGYTENEGDFNDNDTTIFPGAIEICGDGIDQDCNGSDLECIPEDTVDFVMETDEVEINHQWKFVAFSKTYINPVVVAKTASLNGAAPGVVRVKNVTSNGFEIRFQEWEYLDGWHALEIVSYMVMEAGHHVLPNGIHVEAGTFESNSNSRILNFEDVFNQVPVLVSGVTTENEMDAVAGRVSNITTNSFGFRLQEQQTDALGHSTDETAAYIAWEPSSGEVDGMTYIVDSTFNEVTHNFYSIPLYPTFANAPVFVADIQTMDGADTATVRWRNKTGESIEVQIDEEQSFDSEDWHTTEVVGYMAFGPSVQPEDTQGFVMETDEVEINHQWKFVAFSKTYINPVVVARTASLNGAAPGVVRVKNVNSNGFEIRFQEWEYLDDWHALETVSYMVMEAGHHVLPNGIHVEAGTFESNSNSRILNFEDVFNQVPVLVSGVTTENEMDAVAGRVSNITTNSFGFRLQEQQADALGHSTDETAAYIAWEPSSGEVDGMTYIVDSTFNEVTHNFYSIPLYPTFANAPVFVADIQTMDGADTATVRWRNKTGEGIEVQIDEEQSFDSEDWHTTEVVGYMAFGPSVQ